LSILKLLTRKTQYPPPLCW